VLYDSRYMEGGGLLVVLCIVNMCVYRATQYWGAGQRQRPRRAGGRARARARVGESRSVALEPRFAGLAPDRVRGTAVRLYTAVVVLHMECLLWVL